MVLQHVKARQARSARLRLGALLTILLVVAACGPKRAGVVVATSSKNPAPVVYHETVTVLPAGHMWVDHGAKRYAFHDGLFYRWVPGKRHYAIVKAPHGAAITALPRGHRVVQIRGVTYHLYRGVHYKPTRRKGKTVFVVAKL